MFLLLLAISSFSFPADSAVYSVDSTTTGLAGAETESSNFSSRSFSSAFQPVASASAISFAATVGFLSKGFPDLIPLLLYFSSSNPDENENITIFSLIANQGGKQAKDIVVNFYDGNSTSPIFIGQYNISKLKKYENTTINISWVAQPVGPHNMTVAVDPYHAIPESNETNNNLSVRLDVKAYNVYFGDAVGNVTLDTSLNKSEFSWAAIDGGNIYFSNSDSNISFYDLIALGRNTSGGIADNDFYDADINMKMLNFNDSIQNFWAVDPSTPKQTDNFTVFGKLVQHVPYINSTNASNFITGILWDSSKDTDGQYDTTEKEPLVFVSNINRNQSGMVGFYDYEIKVPVLLRTYNSTSDQLKYYLELR